jgi:hypothetical protein
MKKLRIILSSLCLVAILALTAPTMTVYADGDGGPQGGSNSTAKAAPPASELVLWIILRIF